MKNIDLYEGKQNTCAYTYSILPTFTIYGIVGCIPTSIPAWCLHVTGISVIPLDFCSVTYVCVLVVNHVLSTCVAIKLYCYSMCYCIYMRCLIMYLLLHALFDMPYVCFFSVAHMLYATVIVYAAPYILCSRYNVCYLICLMCYYCMHSSISSMCIHLYIHITRYVLRMYLV